MTNIKMLVGRDQMRGKVASTPEMHDTIEDILTDGLKQIILTASSDEADRLSRCLETARATLGFAASARARAVDEKKLERVARSVFIAMGHEPEEWGGSPSAKARALKVALAAITAYEAAKTAAGSVAWKEGDVAYAKVRIDTPPDEDGWAFVTPAAHPDDVARLGHPEWQDSDQFFGCIIAPPQVAHE